MKGDVPWLGKTYVSEDTTTWVSKDTPRLEFYAYEYQGMEVYKYEGQIPTSSKDWKTINTKEGLRPGDKVFVPHPCADGAYWVGTVKSWPDNDELYADYGNGLTSTLDFGQDDRNCWVATCFGNCNGLLLKADFQ
jgi:hypothetical protein